MHLSREDVQVHVALQNPPRIGIALVGLKELPVHLISSRTDSIEVVETTRILHGAPCSVEPGRQEELFDGINKRREALLTSTPVPARERVVLYPLTVGVVVLDGSEPEVEARSL